MRKLISETLQIPEGVLCSYENKTLICKKDSVTLSREISLPGIELKIEGSQIVIGCMKGNKNHLKLIHSYLSHVKNLFLGLEEKFVYKLEAVNVHFPMTLKVEGKRIAINNFLGEKKPRYSEIMPNVDVNIEGHSITVSSNDKESAGQTAANLEKATKVRGRDRRIYQDGIFIVEKPGRFR